MNGNFFNFYNRNIYDLDYYQDLNELNNYCEGIRIIAKNQDLIQSFCYFSIPSKVTFLLASF